MTCATVADTNLCARTHDALRTIMRCIIPSMFKAQQPWALMGSTASVLQGIDGLHSARHRPRDDDGGRVHHGGLHRHVRRRRPAGELQRAAPYASHFGIFEVGGVKVEVMGDLVIRAPTAHRCHRSLGALER